MTTTDSAEVQAIKARADENERLIKALGHKGSNNINDIRTLLSHVDALAERVRTLEAALEDIDQLISYPEESGCERGDMRCLLDKVRSIAFAATLAATAANGENGGA